MAERYERLRRQWNELAPYWIEESRAGGDVSRKGMLDAYMLNACGDVRVYAFWTAAVVKGGFPGFCLTEELSTF